MLIEHRFKLNGPGCICTPITGCFHDKAIISKKNIRLDCLLFTAKILQEVMHFTSLYLGQITNKIQPQNVRF